MTTILRTLTVLLLTATAAFAQSHDTDLKVSRRTLDREQKASRPKVDHEELTRGLQIVVKNVGTKPVPEGEVEWTILVSRAGDAQRNIFTTGKEKLNALKTAEAVTFNVGAMPVQDRGPERQDMDYQVIVRRGGVEVAKAESKPNFSQLVEAARPLAKKRRKD